MKRKSKRSQLFDKLSRTNENLVAGGRTLILPKEKPIEKRKQEPIKVDNITFLVEQDAIKSTLVILAGLDDNQSHRCMRVVVNFEGEQLKTEDLRNIGMYICTINVSRPFNDARTKLEITRTSVLRNEQNPVVSEIHVKNVTFKFPQGTWSFLENRPAFLGRKNEFVSAFSEEPTREVQAHY